MQACRRFGLLVVLVLVAGGAARAAVVNKRPSRFDAAVVPDPAWQIGQAGEAPAAIPRFDDERAAWTAFAQAHGGAWNTWIDRRTGAPLLVEGSGLAWFDPGTVPRLDDLEAKARSLVDENATLFKVRSSELRLNAAGSGAIDADHAVLNFDRVVDGVPVDGERFVLHLARGRVTAFGASRWGRIEGVPADALDEAAARRALYAHMGIVAGDVVRDLAPPVLLLVARPAEGAPAGPYRGDVGHGLAYRRGWRFVVQIDGAPGIWSGTVDAATGTVIALFDDTKYAQVKGGVYPVSDDQLCPDGCEQTGWPMPYADVTINGSPASGGDMGLFTCAPTGANAVTHLAGPYVKVLDTCGAVSEQVSCDADLDLHQGGGTDCAVPAGGSSGNTHSARSGFYHLNRIAEKGRAWLPSNAWLQSQLTDNVNLNQTCNAYWNGASVNFFKSGGGCNNTGEIAGVFLHEWGHGLDNNDGGGYDNPTEAYADITALLTTHVSCVGRGFFQSGNCGGYGDACLNCTGIRDQDWDQHASHIPATPAGFATSNCGGGDGPCGREQHCEAYVSAEAIWDLAARDLPASGLDHDTAWQLADKLWYTSRVGSGGNAYNCSLPSSDGCGSNSWFTKLRTADDDDGNLANGTPHAAAIFAAFDRHKIACGTAADPSNRSGSSCPALARPVATTTAGSSSVTLQWAAVPNAARYLILRNDQGCGSGHTIIATVTAPATSYTDTDLPNDYTVYYAVQAQGANSACESALSACAAATPRAFAGTITFEQATYACTSAIQVTVRDANIGGPTTTATVSSTSEPAPETIVLTETPPGSAKYVGTIQADGGSAVAGDGKIALASGDLLAARYVDADDGNGSHGLIREAAAFGDCASPVVTQVFVSGVDDTHATIHWQTGEPATSIVHHGPTKPPSGSASTPGSTTGHAVSLAGLQPCTVYWFSVESQDPAGNVTFDTNGGAYYHFETLGDLGSGLQSCHGGRVSFGAPVSNCTDALSIRLTDLDLNGSPTTVESVQVDVASTSEPAPEVVTLTETGPNTSQFTGSIATTAAPPAADGKITLLAGDLISVLYRDADDGTGLPALSNASAVADCTAAAGTIVEVVGLQDASAQIHWITTEPTTGRIDWGATPALGATVTDATLALDHTLSLTPLTECGRYYFRVMTTDAYGNVSVLDAGGAPYSFNTWRIPAGLFNDDFETATGWTLDGDWQIDVPQGKGTPPGDPTSAFRGTKVLGQDLTGLGAHPGDYEAGTTFRATSPAINASGLSGGVLRFRRKLSVGDGGLAAVTVLRNGVVFDVWTSTSVSDTDWTSQTVNLSPYADGAASLKIQFREKAGPSLTHSGWNIDHLVVSSSSQPAFQACGGCSVPPSFAGAGSANDMNACDDSGILVKWIAAAAWGSGSTGTYSVYRGTSASFVPGPSNRIATGITGTSYLDASAPNDTVLYYVVRAENDETCGGGPANGGDVDANTVRVSGVDQTSQPAPGSVGDSLVVGGVNDTHVRLSWNVVSGASAYRVYRSSFAGGTFTRIAEVTGAFFEDRDQFTTVNPWYYVVRAVDACGNEEP